jgi:hypothetical protein
MHVEKPGIKSAAAPNRNVVSRRVARQRVEARTTEFDCSGIAELFDKQAALDKQAAPKAIEPDLEADIEIAEGTPDDNAARASGRLAHTMRRGAPELASGSQPNPVPSRLPLPAPDLTPQPMSFEDFEAFEAQMAAPVMIVDPPTAGVTTAIAAVTDATLTPRARRSGMRLWWIVGVLAFVASSLALVAALRI